MPEAHYAPARVPAVSGRVVYGNTLDTVLIRLSHIDLLFILRIFKAIPFFGELALPSVCIANNLAGPIPVSWYLPKIAADPVFGLCSIAKALRGCEVRAAGAGKGDTRRGANVENIKHEDIILLYIGLLLVK